jgi:hypothetical protein
MATRRRVGSRKIKNRSGGKRVRNTRAKRGGKMIRGGEIAELEKKWSMGFKAVRKNKLFEIYKVEWVPTDGKPSDGQFKFDFSVLNSSQFKDIFSKAVFAKLNEYMKSVFSKRFNANNPVILFNSYSEIPGSIVTMKITNDSITKISITIENNTSSMDFNETEGEWSKFKEIVAKVSKGNLAEGALYDDKPIVTAQSL